MYIHIYIHHNFSIHSSIDGHLGCFHVLAIINNAAKNIGVQISFQFSVLVTFGYIPRSGIAGSHDSPIFNFLRILHTVFHNGCTDLQSQQQGPRVPFSPHAHQQFFSPLALMMAIPTGVK